MLSVVQEFKERWVGELSKGGERVENFRLNRRDVLMLLKVFEQLEDHEKQITLVHDFITTVKANLGEVL